jgi:hypothetical protein
MSGTAMVLHMRRLLRNIATVCTLKEIQGQQQRRHAGNNNREDMLGTTTNLQEKETCICENS